MRQFARTLGTDVLQLSGVRLGESAVRDEKLLKGCAAGGECGLPDPGEGVYGPIINWKTCKVVEWLGGKIGPTVNDLIGDLLPHMAKLLDVYEVKQEDADLFGTVPPPITGMRFGCIGCPAISSDKVLRSRRLRKRTDYGQLARIYGIWAELYKPANRCVWVENGKSGMGPVRMDARQRYFGELLSIQHDASITLVTAEDETFIRDCWERRVYPRGWSEADETVQEPDTTMFAGKDRPCSP